MTYKDSLLRTIALLPLFLVAPVAYTQSLPQTALTIIHQITPAEGTLPSGRLVQGPDGSLYGVMIGGGTHQWGSVFKITTGGALETLYSFDDPTTSDYSVNGANPVAGPIFGPDGNLYGSTTQGGPAGAGTVFRITLAGSLTTLATFGGVTQGLVPQPNAPLYAAPDGYLYGSTLGGGAGGGGTVFRLSLSGTLSTLYSFPGSGSLGALPDSALIMGPDGELYGNTNSGGAFGGGTVFKLTLNGIASDLHSFPNTSTNSIGGVILGTDGAFYGLTMFSDFGGGIAYRITSGGVFTTLHTFGCDCSVAEGAYPSGTLTLGSDGNFYGVTNGGGINNDGVIFRMTSTGVVTTLHSFDNSEGDGPVGGVIEGSDGRLYGMTSGVFSHNPSVYKLALIPPAPTGLTASVADGKVTLAWTAARSANTYDVYQGSASGAELSTPVLTGVAATSATIAGLKDGSSYYFTIVAVNEAGTGPASSEVSATPLGAPTGLTAVGGNGEVTLNWTVGAAATTYSVFQGTSSGGESTTAIASGITSTSAIISGLTNGNTYYFKVASVNGSAVVVSVSEASATPRSGNNGGGGEIGVLELALVGLLAAHKIHHRRIVLLS